MSKTNLIHKCEPFLNYKKFKSNFVFLIFALFFTKNSLATSYTYNFSCPTMTSSTVASQVAPTGVAGATIGSCSSGSDCRDNATVSLNAGDTVTINVDTTTPGSNCVWAYTSGDISPTIWGLQTANQYTISGTSGSATINVYRPGAGGYNWTFNYVAAPSITPSTQSVNGIAGTQISATTAFTASNLTNPTYTISPSLPSGLTLNASTGVITGTPSNSQTSTTYTVTATSGSSSATATIAISILGSTQNVVSKTLTQGVAATPFIPVIGSGGSGTYTYSLYNSSNTTATTLPTGLSFSSTTGQISGTPTASQTNTTYTVRITDTNNNTSSNSFSLIVNNGVVATQSVPSTTLTQGVTGTPFIPVTGSGGSGSYSYSLYDSTNTNTATLPTGLSFNGSTGQITGTPTTSLQNTSFTVRVTDANNVTASNSFSLIINSSISASQNVSSTTLTQGVASTPFTPVIGSGGSGTYTYSLYNSSNTTAATLPTGLSFSSTTGQISGTPTANLANTTYTVRVTDTSNNTASNTFNLTVAATVTSVNLVTSNSNPIYGQSITLTATVTGNNPTGTINFSENSSSLGSVSVNSGVGTLSVSNLSAGSHNIIATYSGNSNNASSNSSIVTVTVNGRPDPTSDASVNGQMVAQVSTAIRFTKTQLDNVWSHLQMLHSGSQIGNNKFNIGLGGMLGAQLQALMPAIQKVSEQYGLANNSNDSNLNPNKNIVPLVYNSNSDNNAIKTTNDCMQAIDKCSSDLISNNLSKTSPDCLDENNCQKSDFIQNKNSLRQALFGNLPAWLWASGNLDYGSMTINGSANKFKTSGLTLGMDIQIADNLVSGMAIGYGSDDTSIDNNGTRTKSSQGSLSIYGTYKPKDKWFIDGILGYGNISTDNTRFSVTDSSILTGTRTGNVLFGTIAASNQSEIGKFKIETYAKVDMMSLRFNSYSEVGQSLMALSYDSIVVNNQSTSLGIVSAYNISFANGILTPTAKLQYTHNFNGNLNQGLYYSDLGPNGGYYNLTTNTISSDVGNIGIGIAFTNRYGLRSSIGYALGVGTNSYLSNSLRLDASIPF